MDQKTYFLNLRLVLKMGMGKLGLMNIDHSIENFRGRRKGITV